MPATATQPKTKIASPQVRGVDMAAGRVHAILSTQAEDRDGDVIIQSGWKLQNFQRHAPLIDSHDYRRVTAQLGVWENVRVEGDRLVGTARFFAGQGNAAADWALVLASQNVLAFSVGFQPLVYEERKTSWGGWGYTFLESELLECSAVVVPAQAEALQTLAAKAVDPAIRAIVRGLLAGRRSTSVIDPATRRASERIVDTLLARLRSGDRPSSLGPLISGVSTRQRQATYEGIIEDWREVNRWP